jgi:hypothetical protein
MMKLHDSRGFVSLLTTIIISLLLLVVTLSMVTLETLQLRKAEDSEQSLRAYYTAEAGVEDAVSKVLSGTAVTGCATNPNFDIPGAAGWTCQKVTFSGKPFGKLDKPDQAQTVDPGTRVGPQQYHSVIIEWDQSTDPVAAHYNFNAGAGFPADGGWTAAAAPIELSIVQYPQNQFASNDARLTLQNLLVYPGGVVGGGPLIDIGTIKNGGPRKGDCRPARGTLNLPGNPATKYNCYIVLTGFNNPSVDYLFRIRSRYAASSYEFSFKQGGNGSGSDVTVPDGTATIDVTARAGQTYRRVISKLPLTQGAAAGLNYVMYSDTDICKNFEVIDNTAQPGCPY